MYRSCLGSGEVKTKETQTPPNRSSSKGQVDTDIDQYCTGKLFNGSDMLRGPKDFRGP